MTVPGPDDAERPAGRKLILRLALLMLLVVAAWMLLRGPLAGLVEPAELIRRLEALGRARWAPTAFVALWMIASPLAVPVTPLVITGAAVFGVALGSLYSFLGGVGGAVLTYALGRVLGRDTVHRWLGERRLERVEGFLAEHGFWMALRIRFLPIPFAAVNYSAALVAMPFRSFLAGTSIGLAGALSLYTYFSHLVIRATAAERGALVRDLSIAVALLLLLTFAPNLWRWWRGTRGRTVEASEEQPGENGGQS